MQTKVDYINLLVFCSVGSLALQRVTTQQWIEKKSEFRNKIGAHSEISYPKNKLMIIQIYRAFALLFTHCFAPTFEVLIHNYDIKCFGLCY